MDISRSGAASGNVVRSGVNGSSGSSSSTTTTSSNCNKSDLNLLVKNIVKILLTTSKYLHCPFCADEYLFEFTLKHHLLKNHERDLEKIVRSPDASIRFCESNICPYCGALFYYISALPKHIMNSHSRECLMKWQAIEQENSLVRKLANDPSIQCVPCSPGLSDFFDELTTGSGRHAGTANGPNGGSRNVLQLTKPSPLLKTALRNVNRITAAAANENGGGIDPTGTSAWSSFGFDSTQPRRNLTNQSVRRELHFGDDRPPSGSPSLCNLITGSCSPSPSTESISSVRKSKFQRKRFNLRSIKPKLNFRKYVLSKFSKKYHCKIITSTPNNFLDDGGSGSRDSTRFLHNQERWNRIHFE
uniref:C2H2-type domain-containing protein n=1 Tax=Anopheles epiroticus TaxID=199890 RepID=A0A182PMU5_9DIPT